MAIQKGTGFTNLNRIMQANKGNKLGQTVSSGIQGQVQGVKTQVKSAQEQFNEEAQKNRLDTQESANKRSEILGRFAPSSGASAVQTQPPAGSQPPAGQPAQPAQPANLSPVSDQEITDFTKLRTGTYTGPKELQDSMSLFGKAQQAEQLGGLAKSEGGRQELLRRFVGGKDYTAGQRQLDTSILGQQPSQLGSAAREARGTTQQVSLANQQASNLAQEYANKAKTFGEETTKLVGETKNPLSTALDTNVSEKSAAEQQRVDSLKEMQDLLVGDNADYAGLDKMTRAGLALQSATDRGYLKDGDISMLLGKDNKTGLIQRGLDLGLDVNAMLNERIKNQAAQNVGRSGVASESEIAKLNALDRLAGKQGTDLEFLQGQGKYAAGNTGFDINSLEDYISKTEKERAASDKAYADKLAAEQARYLNQAMAYGQSGIGGALGAAAGSAGMMLNPIENLDPRNSITNAANIADASGQAVIGSAGAMSQGQNAMLEGLTKLNVGGQSLANTEAGKQLLKAIELKSKMENEILGTGGNALSSVTSGYKDIAKGTIGTKQLAQIVGAEAAKDIASKTINNVGKSVGNAVSSITGGGIKISDEDLKTDIDYNPKDVQKFMDRIKPAAYNYKDEVKDSPMASKNRELGVMAQDLEDSKLGKESVTDTKDGKVVDYDNLEPKMLASIAALNKRLNELEKK